MASPSTKDAGNSIDLVDIQEIKEDVVILKDGSLRQIIMVGGVNFALKSELEQQTIIQEYQTFLNGVDFPLQILVHSRKVNIAKYIATLLERRRVEESPLLQNQIDEYTTFIKGFVEKNAIMEKVFLVVVPFYPNITSAAKEGIGNLLPFFKSKKNEKKGPEKDEEKERVFRENLIQMSQRTSGVTSGIIQMGLEATTLGYEQLVELFYNFYNPQTIERQDISIPQNQ